MGLRVNEDGDDEDDSRTSLTRHLLSFFSKLHLTSTSGTFLNLDWCRFGLQRITAESDVKEYIVPGNGFCSYGASFVAWLDLHNKDLPVPGQEATLEARAKELAFRVSVLLADYQALDDT